MINENQNHPPKRNAYERMQIPLHLGMGGIYIIFGTLVLYIKYFGSIELSAVLAYALGGLMIIYGIFRIWRGITLLRQSNRRLQR